MTQTEFFEAVSAVFEGGGVSVLALGFIVAIGLVIPRGLEILVAADRARAAASSKKEQS